MAGRGVSGAGVGYWEGRLNIKGGCGAFYNPILYQAESLGALIRYPVLARLRPDAGGGLAVGALYQHHTVVICHGQLLAMLGPYSQPWRVSNEWGENNPIP